MQSSAHQIRQVIRRLSRTPMFTVMALLTIAIGVGANTAVFSVVDGVLLKPLPYPRPDELIQPSFDAAGLGFKDLGQSPSTYFTFREQNHSFQDIGLYQPDSVNVTGLTHPEQVQALEITAGTLPILGAQPALGRLFTSEDDSPGGADTAVVSYGFWRTKLSGDPAAIGRTIAVDGKPRVVIGVLPQDFRCVFYPIEPMLYLPLQLDRSNLTLGNFDYPSIARLKPGVTIAQSVADMARLLPVVFASFPPPPGYSLQLFYAAKFTPTAIPLKSAVVGNIGGVLWVLMGGIGFVLLIACANIANLLLVRAEGRQHELAIRAALGASRKHLAVELFLESSVLGIVGSALGLFLAYVTLPALIALAPSDLPRAADIRIDVRVLLFACGVAFLASLLASLLPILKYAGARLGTGLRESGRTVSESRERHRARNALVVGQVALAFVLLICSGLMIRTFRAMTRVQPGFSDPASVQTFSILFPDTEVPDPEKLVRLQGDIQDRIGAIPGVSSVGFGSVLPMMQLVWQDPVFVEDRPYRAGEMIPLRRFKSISPGYLSTLGTPLIAGRDFGLADIKNMLPAAIVSESLAREITPAAKTDPAAALGKRIRGSDTDDWREVVGVVADVYQDGVTKDPPPTVYWPIKAANLVGTKLIVRRWVYYVIRTPLAGSAALMDNVRRAVWASDPNLPISDVHLLDYYYRHSMARTSFTLLMLAIAGGMALLLGVVGLYGVIAYSVSQRTREIGIRMALGAQRDDVTRMFVRHGLALVGIGVVCGLASAAVTMSLMRSLLFGVKPGDPMTYLAVSAGLIATAVVASYIPSRRAAKVDPSEALRAE